MQVLIVLGIVYIVQLVIIFILLNVQYIIYDGDVSGYTMKTKKQFLYSLLPFPLLIPIVMYNRFKDLD